MKTVTMKPSELIGAALDWATAQALGYVDGEDAFCDPAWFDAGGRYMATKHKFRPSTVWAQGGPLIGQYHLMVAPTQGIWEAMISDNSGFCIIKQHGATPLIAACRAIAVRHFGDTVEIPIELVQET